MRKVELKMNEQRKYEEIKNLVNHGGNKKRATLKVYLLQKLLNKKFFYCFFILFFILL